MTNQGEQSRDTDPVAARLDTIVDLLTQVVDRLPQQNAAPSPHEVDGR